MRKTGGQDVFARLALPRLTAMLNEKWVLLDAVYCPDELRCYEDLPSPMIVLAIETSKALRADILAQREERSMISDELERRDRFELDSLGLREVLGQASHTLLNDGALSDFEKVLQNFAGEIRTLGLG